MKQLTPFFLLLCLGLLSCNSYQPKTQILNLECEILGVGSQWVLPRSPDGTPGPKQFVVSLWLLVKSPEQYHGSNFHVVQFADTKEELIDRFQIGQLLRFSMEETKLIELTTDQYNPQKTIMVPTIDELEDFTETQN